MDAERWRRIEDLYHAALEHEQAGRTVFLAEACGGDRDLQREVSELLAQQGSLLDRPAWAPPDLKPGSRLNSYEIVSKLGEGGMGLVYRARDTKLNRAVAIKVLSPALADDSGRLARFEREAKALAALNHPNIAQIYSVEDGALVLELVEGETLKGPLPIETALDYAGQIAEALAAAHDKGIVHRDLKPENIKVTPQGVVKVLDFGLAAIRPESDVLENPPAKSATAAGMILGTAAYMSPEQARGQAVDKRADIWAFGCVLYEMLTGRRAFPGDTGSDSMAAVLSREPDPDAVPPRARRLVQRCLEKDPKRRLQAIGDWRLLIEDGLSTKNTSTHRIAWGTAGVLALALAALSFIHFRGETVPAPPMLFRIYAPEQTTFGNAFALSPDGRQLAFTAVGLKGDSMIWIRPLDAFDAHPLPGTEGASYMPFWSPDSRYLAFGTGGKLKKIEVAGGSPHVLCDAPQIVTGGSWSPNGTILFASNAGGVIWKVPASGGGVEPVTKLAEGDAYHLAAQFLPDGRHFIYVRLSQTSARGVYVGSIDAKPGEQESPRLVSADFARYAEAPQGGGYLLFLQERTLVAQSFNAKARKLSGDPVAIAEAIGLYATRGLFSVSANGVLAYRQGASVLNRLTWFDRTGRVAGYPVEAGRFENLALSPDGTRLATQRPAASGGFDIWLTDLVRANGTRFTFGPGLHVSPVWSPDGTRIAYALERNDGADVFQKDSNGAGAEEAVFHHTDNAFPQDWSKDGRFLLVAARGAGTLDDLWVVSLTGEHKATPFLQTPFYESQAQFSPDGRWVAYMSDLSGQSEIYVRPFPATQNNGGQWMISTGGGFQPRWRGDGKELFYLSKGRIMALDISTTPTFKAGAAKVLFEVPIYTPTGPVASAHVWDVSADGKRFLINVDMSANRAQPINLILNWTAALKK